MEKVNLDKLKECVRIKKNKLTPYIKNPKVTLIMQFFNHANFIPLHSERIKKNKIIEEVIICEDGSSDNSLNLWNQYLTRRNDIVIRTNDFHEIISYNRASRYANGEYLCFCQDDDLLPANDTWLRNAIKLFEEDKKLGLIGCISGDNFKNNNDINFQRRQGKYNWYATDRLCKNSKTANTINTKLKNIKFRYISSIIIGPVIIKKELFDKLGGWNYDFSEPGICGIGLDWDLSFKCWKEGYRVGCMPIDLKLNDDIENNKLEDKYFYYRYGFRGTCNFGYDSRTDQYNKNIKKIFQNVNSYGNNFLEIIYNNVETLNKKLDLI
jgi:hypothetical protein